ncbi:MarR family transcriptional regulator [Actinocrispum sp. NPDC049592]|uniref:MarR family winged helix-turn-helix transcriptional regulator n=1 Tax=Actinocrispum sp. NPDC049592 TaxID=3154835 RepID=UPI003439167F
MVAIADSTVEKATGQLTLTQFRALRTTVTLTPVTMTRVAQELDITPSSVTRACERLVTAGLLQKAPNPLNRREILLAPTAAGRQTVNRVDQDRRAALTAILDRLPPEVRASVVAAFGHFARAANKSTTS